MYNGACVNCHEETYIMEQIYSLYEPISVSQEFADKVEQQKIEIKENRKRDLTTNQQEG